MKFCIQTILGGFCALLLMLSCAPERKKVVAVSQCSMDEWRNQMNEEMRREAFFHSDLDVEIHSTPDNTKQQIADIESFIQRGVDAIVVAPNEWEPLRPVIERAYDAGIPVVLIDRKVNSDKYTAFVGGDNVEVGHKAAHYIRDLLPQGGNVVEIEGLASSTSSQERKQGLHEVLDSFPDIHVVADVTANWQRQRAFDVMDSIGPRIAHQPIDIVFAYNDRMAIGARQSLEKNLREGRVTMPRMPLFIGVDALLNDTVGVGRVEDGTLEASFLYQTGGDKAIHTAACILNGLPYEREQVFETSLVNRGNVHLMRIQASHIADQDEKIEFLNTRLDQFFKDYSAQKVMLWTFIALAMLLLVVLVLGIRFFLLKHRMNAKLQHKNELLQRQRDELEAERDKLIEAQMTTAERKAIEEEMQHTEERKEKGEALAPQDQQFLDRFNTVVAQQMVNTELTVDMLGAEMNLGRVQLYRRIKALTGHSPNELLRIARLNRGKELLQDGHHNISEAAYAVGFSSPSYFAKCYRDHFGMAPTESLKTRN